MNVNDANGPYLQITEQPQERGYRYRYASEGATHGGILGVSTVGDRKTSPAVEVKNYQGHATIVAQLVTSCMKNLHPHSLTGKNCANGICTVRVGPTDMTTNFPNLGIQRVTKKQTPGILKKRYLENKLSDLGYTDVNQLTKEERDALEAKSKRDAENVDLTAVRIMFITYIIDPIDGQQKMLSPVFSDTILDCKATYLSQLKIAKLSKMSGSAGGNDEIWLLCEKVQKDDIKIKFSQLDEQGNEVWFAFGEFFPTDVHKQVAIVFKSPPFHDPYIKHPVQVQIQLHRVSDREVSPPHKYTYTPVETTPGIGGMKAFTHSTNLIPAKPPKKNAVYRAPNPQHAPLDPSQIMQPGQKRRRVETNQQQGFIATNMQDNINKPEQQDFASLFVQSDFLKPEQNFQNFDGQNMNIIDVVASNETVPMSYQDSIQLDKSIQPSTSVPIATSQTFTNMMTYSNTNNDYTQPKNEQKSLTQPTDKSGIDVEDLFRLIQRPTADIQTDSSTIPNSQDEDAEQEHNADSDDDDGDEGMVPSFASEKNLQSTEEKGDVPADVISQMSELKVQNEDKVKSPADEKLEAILKHMSNSENGLIAVEHMKAKKQSLLHAAVMLNNIQIVKILLQHGLNPAERDICGQTPVHVACFFNHAHMLPILLPAATSDNIDWLDYEGFAPIHIAAMNKAKECVQYLARFNDNDVNLGAGKDGKTPLQLVVAKQDPEMASFLITKCFADIEGRNFTGQTALHLAAASDNLKMAELLLQHGASVDAECQEAQDEDRNIQNDDYGCTPLHYARSDEMKNLLQSKSSFDIESIEESMEHLDPLVRHQLCCLLNKAESSNDRFKLAKSCNINIEKMKEENNETEYLLTNCKQTISSLQQMLQNLGREDAVEIMQSA